MIKEKEIEQGSKVSYNRLRCTLDQIINKGDGLYAYRNQ